MKSEAKKCIVFDLDDTLFQEIEYLKSAYRFIAELLKPQLEVNLYPEMIAAYESGESALDIIFEKYEIQNYTVKDLVYIYRYHFPDLQIEPKTLALLVQLKNAGHKLGIITDGRSKSQRNKLKALGIIDFFDDIVISGEIGTEKPDPANYLNFVVKYPLHRYCYIGDNTGKDFITPNRLGWTTIGVLDKGVNIHKQDFSLAQNYLPDFKVNEVCEIINYL